jgi:hypothetical protein
MFMFEPQKIRNLFEAHYRQTQNSYTDKPDRESTGDGVFGKYTSPYIESMWQGWFEGYMLGYQQAQQDVRKNKRKNNGRRRTEKKV